jgi:hypothetical protein
MAENLTLTNGKLVEVATGLAGLDGIRLSKEEFKPFRFDDTETLWAIVANTVAVQEALKVFERAKKALAAQHGLIEGMKVTDEHREAANKFFAALEELNEKNVSVPGLAKISRAKLQVAKNGIPPSVLAKLAPILED